MTKERREETEGREEGEMGKDIKEDSEASRVWRESSHSRYKAPNAHSHTPIPFSSIPTLTLSSYKGTTNTHATLEHSITHTTLTIGETSRYVQGDERGGGEKRRRDWREAKPLGGGNEL